MANHPVAKAGSNGLLKPFYFLAVEFHHIATFGAYHVIVMIAVVDFIDCRPIVKIVAHNQSSGLELGQNPVNRSNTHIFTSLDQGAIDVFSGHVAKAGILQNLEYFHPGQGDFKPCSA